MATPGNRAQVLSFAHITEGGNARIDVAAVTDMSVPGIGWPIRARELSEISPLIDTTAMSSPKVGQWPSVVIAINKADQVRGQAKDEADCKAETLDVVPPAVGLEVFEYSRQRNGWREAGYCRTQSGGE